MQNQHPRIHHTLRPEEQLVVCCARTVLDVASIAQIHQLLRSELDWTYTLRIALRHGIMPLLHTHLQAIGVDVLPSPVAQRLRDLFQHNARRNLFLSGELVKLLRLLDAHGLRAVPFKGPVLALAAYGNLALRQFSDLDLLVHRCDVPAVKALLQRHAYSAQPQGYPLHLTPAQEAAYLQSQCNYNFVSPADTVVEVHWDFAPRYFVFPYDPDAVWQRLGATTLVGTSMPQLAVEDVILFLCVHGAKHCWERLAWICDIAQLIRTHPGLNWNFVLDQAGATGSKRMLLLGVHLAHTLQPLELPSSVLVSMATDRTLPALAQQVWKQLFQGMNEPPADDTLFQLFHLQTRERWRDRVRYCIRWALSPTVSEWAWVRLPPALDMLYYGLRPLRLLGIYGPRFFKRSMQR